jgi:CheY-like chemotaxis protein
MQPPPVPASLRVLIVDDCPDTTWSLALLMRLWGHEAAIARDGPRALALADDFCPDVVLLDMAMPGMDGCEVARGMRRRDHGDRPYLLAMSGYGRQEDRLRALEAGCNDHWLKPVDLEALQELLATFKTARC